MSQQEVDYREHLHRTPQADVDNQKTRITLWAPACLMLYGALMPLLIIEYYVLPYQRGTGQLLADGSVDLFTGEAILAMFTAPVYIGLGLIVALVVRKRYKQHPAE